MPRSTRRWAALALLTLTALTGSALSGPAGATDLETLTDATEDVGVAYVDGVRQVVREGDVVARGSMNVDGTCDYPKIEIGAEHVTNSYQTRLRSDPGCLLTAIISRPLPEPGTINLGTIDDFVRDPSVSPNVMVDPDDDYSGLADIGDTGCGGGGLADCGEPRTWIKRAVQVKHTILEQFNITAYERIGVIKYEQNTYDGWMRGATSTGSCYVSAFPGNEIKYCDGHTVKRSGDYVDSVRYARFDNRYIGPEMYVQVRAMATVTSGPAGYCAVIEGSFPPGWEDDCEIQAIKP